MRSRELIEPQAREFIERFERPVLSVESLPALRSKDVPPAIDVADLTVQHVGAAWVYAPKSPAKNRGAILHIHGGGFVLGNAQSERDWSAWLATQLDCIVVAPDYRLAPEFPHPTPLADCYATLKWLHENAGQLGVDRERIAVFGGSAGGGLAAAVALMARDRCEVSLRFQCLLYPMLDDRTWEVGPYAGEYVWTREDNAFGWRCLLGREPGGCDVSAYAAPARAEDLNGLPPTYLWVGALDLFAQESIQYGTRLLSAGVAVELHVFPGVTHGNILVCEAPSTKWCRKEVLRVLTSAVGKHL